MARRRTEEVALADKPYFRIGEVATLVGVEPHVLRYWESEFRSIRPEKTRSNQRMYRRKDVETLLQVKCLLYDQGYRIEGAKRRLRELAGEEPSAAMRELATEMRSILDEIEKIVDEDESS